MLSRPYIFLLLIMLGFFNPVTLFWFQTSPTFIAIVPLTLLIWFIVGWQDIVKIQKIGNRYEVLLGLGIYASNIVRNVFSLNGRPMFGLSDMLIAFISVSIAFYGFRGLKHFTLPIAYLSILIVGYQLEFAITEIAFLQNFLAHLVASMLNLFTIGASANANLVTVYTQSGVHSLVIDADCTGFKGMLAYGSLAILMILDVKTTYKRKALCTTIGLIGTFLVNILRLLTIFLAVYFVGIEAGLAVHTYLSYGLFIIWVFVFWIIAFKYLLKPMKKTADFQKTPINDLDSLA